MTSETKEELDETLAGLDVAEEKGMMSTSEYVQHKFKQWEEEEKRHGRY